ncbi:MAG: hypothetical protein ABIK92_21780 [Pseudomonadota bacterium]
MAEIIFKPAPGTGGGGTDDQVASEVPFTPVGNIEATDVQAAIAELDTEKAAASHGHAVFSEDTDGFAPGPTAAEIASGKYMKADGSWDTPPDNDTIYVHPNHSGEVTSDGEGAQTIANDAVTYAKMQNVSATSRVLGRVTAGAGDVEELTGAQVAGLHNIADHADTSATGAELNTLTGGASSDAQLLHDHADKSEVGHTHAHNDTTSKQGGTTSEYYHLTSAQHDALTSDGDVDNADLQHTHDFAPSDSQYIVKVADSDLSNEWVIYPVLPMTYNDTQSPGTYFIGFNINGLGGGSGTYVPADGDKLCINDISAGSQPANYYITIAELRRSLVEKYYDQAFANPLVTNANNGFKFDVELSGDTTVNVPSNLSEGMLIEFRFRQDSAGGHTVTWHADYNAGEITDTSVDETAYAITYVLCKYNEVASEMDIVAVNRGYPSS